VIVSPLAGFFFCISKEKRVGTDFDILNEVSYESGNLHNHCSDNDETKSCKLNIEI